MKAFLYWSPRLLAVLYAAFLSLFALDVFGQGHSFTETMLALLMHLVPTFVVIGVLAIAWRWEWVGAALFVILAVLLAALTGFQLPGLVYLMLCAPLLLVAVLFVAAKLHALRESRA